MYETGAGIQPVFQKETLQVLRRVAPQLQMGVTPGAVPGAAGRFDLVDVDASGETHVPVDDHDLAVVAEVHHAGPERHDLRRIEHPYLAPCLQQRLPEAHPPAAGRAHGVHQHAHLHACLCLLRQQVAPARADLVRLENVVLHVDVVPRRLHGRFDGRIGGIPVHQDLQLLHRPGRGAAAFGGHPGLGQQPVARGQRVGQLLVPVGAMMGGLVPRQLAAHVAALELAGPEQEVEAHTEHRYEQEGQDPRQRGQRRPALAEDVQDAAQLQHAIEQQLVRYRDALPDGRNILEELEQVAHGGRDQEERKKTARCRRYPAARAASPACAVCLAGPVSGAGAGTNAFMARAGWKPYHTLPSHPCGGGCRCCGCARCRDPRGEEWGRAIARPCRRPCPQPSLPCSPVPFGRKTPVLSVQPVPRYGSVVVQAQKNIARRGLSCLETRQASLIC